ncbi:MAG: hypothetical protein IT348_01275, partial [Candidatus Eisenbacteria bacterium]|nr:hypothetical protein [Candidatus Eisenbacteria bacterium]
MPRSLPVPALLAVALTGFLLAAPAAHAGEFARAWHQPNLTFDSVAGNLDGDPQDELLFYANLDQQLVLVDGLTGNVEANLTGFKHGETGTTFENIDGDSRLELLLIRPGGGPMPPLTKILDWTPGGYVTLFSHSDPVSVVGYCHLRSQSQFELLEISDTDVRVRDMSGDVLLRASTAISPWTGAEVSAFSLDMDGDGIDELGVTQHLYSSDVRTHFFDWNGAFVPTWSSSNWVMTGGINTDGDPQIEMSGFNAIDSRYAFFDGVTGVPELELPEFTLGQNARVNAFDIDGDGRHEIFASRSSSPGVTPLTRAYKWVTGNYVQMFSDTEDAESGFPVSTRATGQFEFYEETATDAVIRDMSGIVLFRASSAIPGWSGSNMRVATVDLTHDGIAELLIQDDNTVRVVRHVSGNYVQL